MELESGYKRAYVNRWLRAAGGLDKPYKHGKPGAPHPINGYSNNVG